MRGGKFPFSGLRPPLYSCGPTAGAPLGGQHWDWGGGWVSGGRRIGVCVIGGMSPDLRGRVGCFYPRTCCFQAGNPRPFGGLASSRKGGQGCGVWGLVLRFSETPLSLRPPSACRSIRTQVHQRSQSAPCGLPLHPLKKIHA